MLFFRFFDCLGPLSAFVAASLLVATADASQGTKRGTPVPVFACGGKLESEVWRHWDKAGHPFVKDQLIERRLVAAGDTYALYDFEIFFHNLLAMAQRCQRIERQREMASLVTATYAQLVPAPGSQLGSAWVCLGGAVCNSTNRLVNTEVKLNSRQFLAFATSLARGLSRAEKPHPGDFVAQTVVMTQQHLGRWSSVSERTSLRQRIAAKPSDVKDGSSKLFLTDQDLWQIAAYADLAGILQVRPELEARGRSDNAALAAMKEHLTLLLRLFAARTTFETLPAPDSKRVTLADLDAGFWRLYADNRFAAYTGNQKPVVCKRDPAKAGAFVTTETRIDAGSFEPVRDLGWDISHARRLVHFFDAIHRNRDALGNVFGVSDAALPSPDTMAAFARRLRQRVWNQDTVRPLFSNYMSGANGWYRVGYGNGVSRCMEGHPPFGLTDSFPTGGYATWGTFDPELRSLGERLYTLSQSDQEADRLFVSTHYPKLRQTSGGNARMLAELMFWPSLIHSLKSP